MNRPKIQKTLDQDRPLWPITTLDLTLKKTPICRLMNLIKGIYTMMDRFAKLPLSHWNPESFSSPTEPVYKPFDSFENRVINTRNPFSRIQSGRFSN